MKISVDINGINDVTKQLRKLGDDTFTKKVLNAVQRTAARPMLKEVKNKAGSIINDDDQLKRSIGFITGKSKKAPAVYIGPRVKGKFRQPDKTGFYGLFFESGTKKRTTQRGKNTGMIVPRPFLRPSFLAKRTIVEGRYGKALVDTFKRRVARL